MQEVIMNDFINQALLGPLELLGRQILTVLPNVFAMGIIILGGLFTAWAFGSIVERLLRMIGFDHLCDRLGMNAALLRGGVKTDPSRLVGRGLYWAVIVLASIAALGALNLTPINQFAQSLLELCIPGRTDRRRQRRTASCPTHRSLFPLGSTSPRRGHGAGATRHSPTYRRRGIRHYLGRDCAGRSHCIRTRRSRSLERVLGTAAGGPIQIQYSR
jgi:hypothetical protein